MNFKNCFIFGFSLLILFTFTSSLYAAGQQVILGNVSGQVEIIPDGTEASKKAERGMRLYEGDVLKTYKNK